MFTYAYMHTHTQTYTYTHTGSYSRIEAARKLLPGFFPLLPSLSYLIPLPVEELESAMRIGSLPASFRAKKLWSRSHSQLDPLQREALGQDELVQTKRRIMWTLPTSGDQLMGFVMFKLPACNQLSRNAFVK